MGQAGLGHARLACADQHTRPRRQGLRGCPGYYKPDFNFGGVQGGAMPFKVKADPASVKIDPYGPESPDFVVGDDFAHMWCSALAFCQKRFEGKWAQYKREPSGGIGLSTADNFPVFDRSATTSM